MLKPDEIAAYIDHTLLAPDATEEQIEKLCNEAKSYKFAAVCVNGTHTKLCRQLLEGSSVKVCTVVGFPLGASKGEVKAFETAQAVKDGAQEIDMVINIGLLKMGHHDQLLQDIKVVREASKGLPLKVIIETALLSDEEKREACHIAVKGGANFVKTSTGFSKGGASVEDVALMRHVVGLDIGVKAAGGIRAYSDAIAMIEAGASRLGTSSGVAIVKGAAADGAY
ncbi:MAG: deoxyribose-phosphate aldolase [Sphaerochaetaceae bacterium]|jgi:deoxyribose-phosphate aldolase|nr:deoxyribose-phosphate aldolase [Sphaerochaetaceae bacterium]